MRPTQIATPRSSSAASSHTTARRLRARWSSSSARAGKVAAQEWIKDKVPARFHKIGDEVAKFGTIGLINIGVNSAVVNLLWLTPWLHGSQVKAKAVATIVAATSAYFMNRYWTYRHRAKTGLRREYTLFFAFNLVGLFIEVGAVWIAKYWLHRTDLLVLNLFSLIGIGLGTVFRFWAYRTHVFKHGPEPALAMASTAPTASGGSGASSSAPGPSGASASGASAGAHASPGAASPGSPASPTRPALAHLPVTARANGRKRVPSGAAHASARSSRR